MSADAAHSARSLLVCDRSSFLEQRSRLSSQVEQQRFNYKVSVLLPGRSSAPSRLDSALKRFRSSCLIRSLPVHELLDQHFLESAVYHGSVYGLSYKTRLDEDNCVSLMPNGRLSLSLDKDSYELLGFQGKPSRFNHRTCIRFVVSVDLRDRSMAPGGRGYLRLLTGLKSRLQLQTDFLLSHHPGGVASLQPLLSRFEWSEHRPEVTYRPLTDLSCPVLLTSDQQSCDPHSFLEWLGAVDADISRENSSSSFLSSLVCPEPKALVRQALSVSVCGLLLPQDLHHLIEELRGYLESWVSMTVHGFVDSLVSWGENEHRVLRGGHNFYTLLMFHNHIYHLHLASEANDCCPP